MTSQKTRPRPPSQSRALTVVNPALERIERELLLDPRLQSRHTRRAYLADLTAFEAWRGPRPLTKLLVQEYAASLQQAGRSPNSINRALASVRWWARRVADLAYEESLPKEQRDEIVLQASRVASVQDVRGEREIRGRHIQAADLRALLATCARDTTAAGRRDAALFALAWSTGLRRSEIAGLNLDDLKEAGGEWTLQVRGKGNKVRRAYLHGAAARCLRQWLNLRGLDPGPAFCPVRRGGKVAAPRGISEAALAAILDRRGLEAALAEPVTWHDFRRTFAGNLLDSGVDLATVQRLLGHSSPATTSNYDRRGEETRRRAVQKLDLPA